MYYNSKMMLTESLIDHFDDTNSTTFHDVHETLSRQLGYWHKMNKRMNRQRDYMAHRLISKAETTIERLGYRIMLNEVTYMKEFLAKKDSDVNDLQNNINVVRTIFESMYDTKLVVEEKTKELPTDVLQMFLAKEYKPKEHYSASADGAAAAAIGNGQQDAASQDKTAPEESKTKGSDATSGPRAEENSHQEDLLIDMEECQLEELLVDQQIDYQWDQPDIQSEHQLEKPANKPTEATQQIVGKEDARKELQEEERLLIDFFSDLNI